ncbi:MAG: RNA-binding transcriptional accessory protein [Lachnospiraceae bacterium]|nr:RNA-binding transcriptional accessory protein [Lachnospiraceae bacterium]
MNIIETLSNELQIKPWQAEAVVRLIDEGSTIPFIARYRKEATGAMNDELLRTFDERLRFLRGLNDRREAIRRSIDEQGKLTPLLAKQLDEATTLAVLEDLYRPYVKKRKTRAAAAREKGLGPLAEYLLKTDAGEEPLAKAQSFIDPEKGIPDAKTALRMAEDILAEEISDNASYRGFIRRKTLADGTLVSEVRDKKADSVYENYYQYEEKLGRIPGHRILAMNRGEKEKILSVRVKAPAEDIITYLDLKLGTAKHPRTGACLHEAASDAYKRLIAPSIENELRGELTKNAEEAAIAVFGKNLSQLLMQPPIPGKTVLGWDPAFRTGCKLCIVDPTGKVLFTTVIYPTAPQNKVEEARKILKKLIEEYKVDIISLGNGTASRESEAIISAFLKESGLPVSYAIVSEAGASVYSASRQGSEEFPNFDVGQRSSASIARRLQDPLAELVKIDPKSIGVGQYQHDMNETRLTEALTGVVENCVNRVGVDVNTASASLLAYISGISKTVAGNIVRYREENGRFMSRRELLKVPKLGPKAFEQSAGFLRIRDGKEPLDMTGVHPESYDAARKLLTGLGFTEEDLLSGKTARIRERLHNASEKELAASLKIGEYTLRDIIADLEKPGRDPRTKPEGPILRQDVMEITDLKPGMILKGTVRNVIDFGAFVDIGVHQDGLVHISELRDRFVRHPLDVVSVGDIVTVKVLGVDAAKKRISLTMKGINT